MTKRTNRFATALVACAGLAVMTAPTAMAKATDEIRVEIDARALNSAEGVQSVYDKLVDTSRKSCFETGTRGLQAHRQEQACATILLDSFVENTAHAELAAYHTKMRR